jgi:hypothetical protein
VPLGELQPLAGYPAASPAVAGAPATDPRQAAVNAVWDRLEEARKAIIHEIALHGNVNVIEL